FTGADLVEDAELRTRSVADARPLSPGAAGFLDGIEQWRVVGSGGVTPIVRGCVAAAGRGRRPDRRLGPGSALAGGAALGPPTAHRASVFEPRSRGARRAIYSWYLRFWPWEGNDLLYGLVRVEARAHPDTLARASALSAWLERERSPLSTPDARWDRLLYPIHDVETYLRSRAPRDLPSPPG